MGLEPERVAAGEHHRLEGLSRELGLQFNLTTSPETLVITGEVRAMKIRMQCVFVVLLLLGLAMDVAQGQKKSKYACDEPQPAELCNAANTCGSASAACTVDINKSGSASSVKPGIANAKSNQFFCVKAGTTVTWMSSNKNTGFTVSFGTDSPFVPDDPIIGGANKPITVKAQNPGCYKYDVGAFYSGAIYGMAGGSKPELVILP
jgi:plastocyanin